MESFESSGTQERDIESLSTATPLRELGLLSCYEARLASTMITRAMDREIARRPVTTKCGRLARPAELAPISQPAAAVKPTPRPASLVHVTGRSALHSEPA